MDVRSPLFQHIALILAGVLFLNPIVATAAQLTVDAQAGGNTSLGQAANGVPIVNIATPNGSGLSHNKFTDYNVGKQGLILNNATERLQSTQQGGIIIGNPNLGGRAAGVILNEVTGSNRSQLKGYTEVAGQAAHVIVANPHGITCDGCGFINTPRATLSTGAPVIENGRLDRFDVDGGDIRIQGEGLNASNVDQFDLITRSAKINAEIHAKRLNIVAGRNEVDAGTLQATAKADDGSDKPQLAIDSSALGGMYAGAIRLVGTEKGVGVKLAGDMAASAGDIQIDANGRLTLNDAAASGQIVARAAQVETQGQVYAGTGLDVQSQGNLVNRGSLAARDRVALSSATTLTNQGHVEAGVNADNSRNQVGSVALAGQQVRNPGSVVANGDLRVESRGRLDNSGGQLLAEGNARIDSGQVDNREGRIVADGDLDLRSAQLDNARGRISAGQAVEIRATALAQQGGVLGSGTSLNVALADGDLDNREGLINAGQALRIDNAGQVDNAAGEISSRHGVRVAAAALDNRGGKLLAETTLELAGERLDNRTGRIAANDTLNLLLDDIDNRGGVLSSRSTVTLDTQRLDNSDQGHVLGAHLALTAQRLLNRNQGLIHGQSSTQVAGAWLDNSGGSLSAGEDLRVQLAARGELDGGLVNADGLLGSEGALSISAARLDNRQGDISSIRDLNLTLLGELSNQGGRVLVDAALQLLSGDMSNDQGLISAGSTLALHAAQIANRQGRIAAGGPLVLRASGLAQQGGELFSKSSLNLDLQGGALNNDGGFINAPGALLLNGLGAVSNRGGEISSRQGFGLAAKSLDNSSGKLISEQDLSVTVAGRLDNRAGTLAGRQVELGAGALDNSDAGLLRSEGRLGLEVSGSLANRGGAVLSAAQSAIQAGELDNSGGQIASQGDLVVKVDQVTQVGGELLTEGDLHLSGKRLDNQKGVVAANGQLALTADAIDNRGGEISSRGTVSLTATSLDNSDSGRLLAAHLNLAAGRLLNRNQGLIFGRDQVHLSGAHLNNAGGTLASDTRVLIELTARAGDPARDGQLINSEGKLSSEGTLSVSAAGVDNSGGNLSSAGAMQITSQGALLNRQGRLLTDAGLVLRSAGLDNRHGQISAVEHLGVTTGRFDNDSGRLTGSATLDVQAGQVSNAQGRIAASGPLSVQASGLAQQGGELFSQSRLTLDLNGGDLNNDAGLLHAPGQLLLNNLGAVSNRQGEISSSQGFSLAATSLDNAQGRLLSERDLTLRIQGVLANLAGLISARGVDLRANDLSNEAGTLFARGDLAIDVTGTLGNADKGLIQSAGDLRLASGMLSNAGGTLLAGQALDLRSVGAVDNRNDGLINSQGTLTVDAASLDSSQGGEVSAKGDLRLSLDRLTQQQGALIGESALTLDLRQGELDNQQGLITSNGPLTLSNLRALDNRGGEISSHGVLALAAASLNNQNGRLISREWLRLSLGHSDNQGGLLSGWQGLQLTGTSLDNRQLGTLSSRDGDLDVQLAGALLNSGEGALVAAGRLDVDADSLDNGDRGILSSGAGQHLLIAQGLDNRGGQIDAVGNLVIDTGNLANGDGLLLTRQDLTLSSAGLDNASGRISASGAATLDVDGTLVNTAGQLASGGPLRLDAETLNNQGGTLASQGTGHFAVTQLNNSDSGTLAANGALHLDVAGAAHNRADGLIYSRDASVQLEAASLDNSGGAIQGQGDLLLNIGAALNNQSGTLQSRTGAVELTAASLDNRQGTLASLQDWVRVRLSGWLRNGASEQGGLIQGQHLDLLAAGNLDNTAGRIHALGGAATLQAGTFDNQRGTLYAQGDLLLRGGGLNNQGGKIGAANIALEHDSSAVLNNQQGIVESRGALRLQGASLDNQGGQLRALGTSGTTFFTLGGLLDNRSGVLETANRDLTLNLGSLLNQNGKLLHAGSGEFGVALAQVAEAGGSFVTQGRLTLKADSWSNDSILQAGHLTLDIGTFEQTANGQLLATGSLTGKGGNWINHGLIASDGPLSLTLSGSYSGNGRVTSQGDLDVKAARLSLSDTASITAGGAATFALGGALLNQGRLTAAENLTLSAASLNNQGTLGSAGRLSLTTPSLVNENGLLFSGDDMALYVDTFINRYADVYSLGALLVARDRAGNQSARFENVSSTLESSGDLAVSALKIINRKDVFSVTERLISGDIIYQCLDCKGRHFDLYYFLNEQIERTLDSDSPSSLIQAGGNLRLSGGSIENSHSTISAAGNILIVGDEVSNFGSATESVTRYRQYRNPVDSEGRAVFAGLTRPGGAVYEYNKYNAIYEHRHVIQDNRALVSRLHPGEQKTNRLNRDYNPKVQSPVPSIFSTYRLVDSIDTVTSTGVAAGAVIQAGGDVTIQSANTIENGVRRSGQSITPGSSRAGDTSSAGNGSTTVVRLNPQLPPNLAQQQVNPLTLPGFSLPSGQNGLFRLSGQAGSDSQARESANGQQWALADTALEQTRRDDASSVQITDVRVDQPGQPQIAVTRPQTVGRNPVDTPSGSQVTVTAVPDQGNADTPQALGIVLNPVARPHKYLIETNPALTELNRFLSSDYMLDLLGYDPDQAQKRLGDGLYEQRLIREAIVARTGQRFIAGLDSDEAMFRYLMNNAIASKEALNLGLGVSLSAEQVAALTHDIVWMEEQQVLGEKVLVPVLYLAQAEGRLAPNGALIQGRDVALISGGDLSNQGTLRASGELDVQAVNIANSGLLQASERLQLLAEDSIRNAQGGIIAGRDVSLIAGQDILNERSITEHAARSGASRWGQTYVDSAARIEASGDLNLAAGRDVTNLGSVLDSRGDLAIQAGRDVTVASVQEGQYQSRGNWFLNERVSQLGAEVSAGRDLQVSAGRDLGVVASQVTAGRDLDLGAERDLMLSSAADGSHFLSRSKRVIHQKDQITQQATEIGAGGSVGLTAGEDMTLISSRISAGEEAYLVAGGELTLLAAQDYDYSLYQKKKKGSFGRKSFRRNETTDITHVGSEISTGGDLSLVSGGDQTYQAASLESGADLILESGGAITFEGVKDLKQESREKSKNSWVWTSAKGRGTTDETLLQSQMIARGDIVIQAVEGLKVDIKQVNQQTISQTIDAMVKADPELAWIKEIEQRGDVDWRQVKEVHDRFKYSHSGLGGAAMIIIAIIVTYLTAGAASGLVAGVTNAAAGSTMAAATAATATTAATSAGIGNIMASAILTSAASGAAISAVNNRGDLGAVFKDVTSSDALKGYMVTGGTAGFTSGMLDSAFGVTGDNVNKITKGFDLSKASDIGKFGAYLGAQGAVQAAAQTAVQGGSLSDNLQNALTNQVQHLLQSVAFNATGDLALVSTWQEGSPEKIALHAVVGGLLSEATGGDFKTGALAAGANEALVEQLSGVIGNDKGLELAVSQLIGVAAATATGGDPAKAAELAKNATAYNRQLHASEEKWLRENAKRFAEEQGISEQDALERLSQQALKDVDYLWRALLSDGEDVMAQAFLANAEQTFTNDLGEQQALFTAKGQQLFRPEMFADTADPQFYRDFVQSGVSRDLSVGLLKELKDSGVAIKDSTVDLVKMAKDHPKVVLNGLWEGVKGLVPAVLDGFQESGIAIGEGAAVSFNEDISEKLNIIYGQDVEAAQQALLALRTFSAVTGTASVVMGGAKLTGKAAEAASKKLDEVINGLAAQALQKSGGVLDRNGNSLLDLRVLTNDQKRVIGEVFGETTVVKMVPGGEKLGRVQSAGTNGIDDLYKVNHPDVDFVVIEYKFIGDYGKGGSSGLIYTADGRQGSGSWIMGSDRLEEAVGLAHFRDVEAAISRGRVETWVVATSPNGSTEIQVLDSLGRVKPVDTSNILNFKENIAGAKP